MRNGLLAFALTVVLASGCLAGPVEASDDVILEGLLGAVERIYAESGYSSGLAPYVVEVAWAAGLSPHAWPQAHPAAPGIVVPADGALISKLRPLYALGLSNAPGSDERRTRILEAFDGQQFGHPALLNDDAFAILALIANGEATNHPAIVAASDWLRRHQSGGWSYSDVGPVGTDMTGIIVSALHQAGRAGDVDREAALEFVRSTRGDAGYAETPKGAMNCDSTVWAIRTLATLGETVPPEDWRALKALRQSDGGFALRSGESSNSLCTLEVAVLYGLKTTERL